MSNEQKLELTEGEKQQQEQNQSLIGLFSHPGWQIYQQAAEETLFTLLHAYFNFSLKETVDGKQRFKSNEQLIVEQIYLRGRIDQLRDTLYLPQESTKENNEQIDSFRKRTWERMKGLFRRLMWN